MSRLFLGVFTAAALLASGAVQAADLEAAKKKVSEICQACHGMDGNSQVPDYPKLAGQNQDYLAKTLRDYKSGARKDPTMNGFAGTLTAQDIDNLAAYFSSQPAVLHRPQTQLRSQVLFQVRHMPRAVKNGDISGARRAVQGLG